jgi:hypothetical protein
MSNPVSPYDVYQQATAFQLFSLIKMLGVEQRQLAAQLGVSTATVSMWATQHRAIPPHHRAALVTWAAVAMREATQRMQKEVQALEAPDLKRAAVEAFQAPITRWQIEVLHEAGTVKAAALKNARGLVQVLEHDPLTVDDLAQVRTLRQVLTTQLGILEEMGGAPDGDPPPAPEA